MNTKTEALGIVNTNALNIIVDELRYVTHHSKPLDPLLLISAHQLLEEVAASDMGPLNPLQSNLIEQLFILLQNFLIEDRSRIALTCLRKCTMLTKHVFNHREGFFLSRYQQSFEDLTYCAELLER